PTPPGPAPAGGSGTARLTGARVSRAPSRRPVGRGGSACGGRQVGGQGGAGGQVRVGDRGAVGPAQGEDAGPVREGEVLGLVVDPAGADLGGDLGQVDADHGGGGEFLLVGRAAVGGPAGHRLLDEGVQGPALLLGVGHVVGEAVHHHGAVVDGVVEGGAGQHQAVDVGDREAHGQAGAGAARVAQRP